MLSHWLRCGKLLLFFLFTGVPSFSFSTKGEPGLLVNALALPRRQFLQAGWAGVIHTTLIGTPLPADAARGAAELDLEYYLRDAFGKNNERLGNVLPSAPPKLVPPRTLSDPLLSLLVPNNDNYSSSIDCLTTRVLMETTRDNRSAATTLLAMVEEYRQRAARSFRQRAAWQEQGVADQYYFDLTAYALWKTALELLKNAEARDVFVRTLGRRIYATLVSQKVLIAPNGGASLVATNAPVIQLLDLFVQCGYIESYTLDTHTEDPSIWLDGYDDEDWRSGAAVNAIVRIRNAATLGACLQLTGEQTRFLPDFLSPTLAALWETSLVANTTVAWESYFLDDTYRPNPKGTIQRDGFVS